MTDDPRAQFVIAQALIEAGRPEEARMLLRRLAHPVAEKWLAQLEAGEPVDTAAYLWDAEMVQPVHLPMPRLKPAYLLVSFLLVMALLLPGIEPFLPAPANRTLPASPVPQAALIDPLRAYCYRAYQDAIQQGRLSGHVESCFEWALGLPHNLRQQALRCQKAFPGTTASFEECLQQHLLLPPGVTPAAN